MSTTTTPAFTTPRHDVSFGGVIRSEWLKLLSIPSTLWAYAIVAAITIGITAQMSASTSFAWFDGTLAQEGMQAAGVNALMVSTDLAVFVVSVLGVLVMAGEYATGTIRSTLTAVPQRVPVLLAKSLVFTVTTFLVGALAVAAAIPISASLLAGNGIEVHLDDPHYWRGAIGSVGYLVSIGLIALAMGAIFRSVIGGVSLAVGVIFVIPIGLGFVGSVLQESVWLQNFSLLLPFNLGRALITHPGYAEFASPGDPLQRQEGLWVIEPWQGALGLLAWVTVLSITAIVLLKRRDA